MPKVQSIRILVHEHSHAPTLSSILSMKTQLRTSFGNNRGHNVSKQREEAKRRGVYSSSHVHIRL